MFVSEDVDNLKGIMMDLQLYKRDAAFSTVSMF